MYDSKLKFIEIIEFIVILQRTAWCLKVLKLVKMANYYHETAKNVFSSSTEAIENFLQGHTKKKKKTEVLFRKPFLLAELATHFQVFSLNYMNIVLLEIINSLNIDSCHHSNSLNSISQQSQVFSQLFWEPSTFFSKLLFI